MQFNSVEYALFLPVVFLVYWFVFKRDLKIQNAFLLISSYTFYGWWNWRFLFLLVFISLVNYFIGLKMTPGNNRTRKTWFSLGILINLSVLGIFKYYNFFIDSFINLVSFFGYDLPKATTKIILPLGISFYIFLSLSYLIDIFRDNLKANHNIVEVLLTFSFFPIILAGPIQRPVTLLPQISSKRVFNYNHAADGLRQMLWGFFVKICVADNLASETDGIFLNYSDYSGSTLMLGMVFYTLQIYADFSGYSNIAIGTGRLFGFSLMQNFNYPYFSRDISEFWKKWHISLTTWFRDYLFLPISFALSLKIKREKVALIRKDLFIYISTSLIVWFLTGLWHGANYTFILWGLINGLLLILYHWQKKPRKQLFKRMGINNNNRFLCFTEGIITLIIIMCSWMVFRSETIIQSVEYIKRVFSESLFSLPQYLPKTAIILSVLFILVEFLQRNKLHALQIGELKSKSLRWGIYFTIVLAILLFGGGAQKFIYFQF